MTGLRKTKNTENAKVGQAKNVRESSKLKRRIIKHEDLVVIDREKKRRKSEELQNNRDQIRDCTRDNIWIKLKKLERTIKGLNTKEDTRAYNSSTLKINRICKGKDKEIIAESSKKVLSKED
ncbi:17562_t:CDS:2 [Gigaspora margarita]|uniref:17562_t:CDS:1 n=1 Tax=Gigaspora margarita TaxID=4874 RepID=A0ABN7VH55_GIGMA|nr:17562_t:CDS:2 [Gigaspora margarita]